MKHRASITITSVGIAFAFAAECALGGAHTWDIVEVFSNCDGTIQFVELREMNGTNGEWHVNTLQVTSQATGQAFTFPANLAPRTGNKRILLATDGFAALPGAPARDFAIPANFFSLDGDTLRYHVYDTWVIPAGVIPTDCTNSYNRTGGAAANSPTNYAGTAGNVSGPCAPCPCYQDVVGNDNQVTIADITLILTAYGLPCDDCAADIIPQPDGDNQVTVADINAVIAAFGPCDP